MRLNELADRPDARKRALRVGRGVASGKGKTAGRGHKGQKSRAGVALRGREGGQMPIHMRLPKRGFRNPFKQRFAIVDLARLNAAIEAGNLDSDELITAEMLQAAGLIHANRSHWRLLGKGPVSRPVRVQANHVSASARSAIEAVGGAVEISEAGVSERQQARRLEQEEA